MQPGNEERGQPRASGGLPLTAPPTGSANIDSPAPPATCLVTLPARASTRPATPPTLVPPGIAARRSAWVAVGRKAPNYNPETIGRTLRLEPVATPFATPFNEAAYVAQLLSVEATGHEQVLVKIGKGGGEVTAAILQMRLNGQGAFKTAGQFTGRSFVDHTPLAVPGVPESREYQLLAMKNNAVIGHPSPIHTVMVG